MIIVRIYEGLGNQLFQYAYAKSLSLSTKHKVFLDVRETGSQISEMNLTHRKYCLDQYRISLPICTNVQHFYPYLNQSDCILDTMQKLSMKGCLPYKFFRETKPNYNESLVHITGNWYLQGWFQDSRYFQKYEKLIKKEFILKNKIKIGKELKDILQNRITVSVHIRRGDYRNISNLLPVNYYYNALKYMKNIIKNPFWIIFSDDINWVKRNIRFEDNYYYVGEREKLKDYEELMIMSCCKHNIIANSTYSWWGAWLNKHENKIVIGPSRWCPTRKGDNILLKDWISISIV